MRRQRRSAMTGGMLRTARRCALAAVALALLAPPLLGAGPRGSQRSAIIPIDDDINGIMLGSIQRRVEAARASGATTLIFEMKTPGGYVKDAMDISRLIMRQPDDGIRTVAWVNPEAYSAGAMISLACQELWMGSSSTIGDCAPIIVDSSGDLKSVGETERAKMDSPVLQIFREEATRNGYDQLLCRAMVQAGIEVWWLEPVGAPSTPPIGRRFVTTDEKQTLIDNVPEAQRAWRLVSLSGGRTQPIDGKDSLLTLSADEAVEYGLARGKAGSAIELAEKLDVAPPVMLSVSGWERFVTWLNGSVVRGLFFTIMILAAYMEFQHPGLMLPATVAIIAAVIFFGAPYAAGLAGWWTTILLVVGLVLLALEIFVIPGFGVAGIMGIALILIAIVGTFVPSEPAPPGSPDWLPRWPTMPSTWAALKTGILVLSGSVFASLIGLALLVRYLPYLPGARRLALGNPEQVVLPPIHEPQAFAGYVGQVGVVVADLRPGGQARFEDEIIEVSSQGQYVVAGTRVQVLRREGANIIVRPLSGDDA